MSILRRDIEIIRGLQEALKRLEDKSLTDAQVQMLELIQATQAVDLDTVITQGRLVDNVANLEVDKDAASVAAIRDYVLGALQMGGPQMTVERLVVSGDNTITLNHRPHTGIRGILNYGLVRLLDTETLVELPLRGRQDNVYVFDVEPQGRTLEGRTVMVQYLYHYDPRDLNGLIGDMILDGLLLTPPESDENPTS